MECTFTKFSNTSKSRYALLQFYKILHVENNHRYANIWPTDEEICHKKNLCTKL